MFATSFCGKTAGSGDWSTVWSFTTEILYVNQLAAFWKMDEGSGVILNDASGQGNNGQTVGTPDWVPGARDAGLKLNGSNQYATVQIPRRWIYPKELPWPPGYGRRRKHSNN